tara:strand:- start:348 stop:557 length:210 start_codon:yes stop_codon:yes gene_type:complete
MHSIEHGPIIHPSVTLPSLFFEKKVSRICTLYDYGAKTEAETRHALELLGFSKQACDEIFEDHHDGEAA